MGQKDIAFQTEYLGTEKISKLLMMYSIPCIVSLMVNSTYEMVDQIFIGRGIGYLGNGATNSFLPFTVLAMGITMMIGDGAASYMSIHLGKNQRKAASQGVAAGLLGITIAGIILAVCYAIWLRPMCRLWGATKQIMPYAVKYGRIRIIGMPFCCINAGFSSIIRADGRPKYSMIGLMSGCLVNLICDPVFIFVLHWGISGAAFATILGQIVNAAFCIHYLGKFQMISIEKNHFKHWLQTLGKVSKLGVGNLFIQIGIVLAMAFENNLFVWYGARSKYGAEIPMAAFGVTTQIFVFISMLINGLANGAQSIFGYNYGAGNLQRVKKTLKMVLCIATLISSITFLILQVTPMSIVGLFGSKSNLYNDFSVKCLRIFFMLLFLDSFQSAGAIFFQAIGHPMKSTILSLSRQIIFLVPAMFVLSVIFGIEGTLYSGPVADGLSFLLAVIFLQREWRSM